MFLSGRDRVDQLVKGMVEEQANLANPHVRADRMIAAWKGLKAQHDRITQGYDFGHIEPLELRMTKLISTIGRDPQMESVLRQRSIELGIGSLRREQSLSHALEYNMTRSRDRGLSL